MYHELVDAGKIFVTKDGGEKVKVIKVNVDGVLEIINPDHKDNDGNVIGQGGSISLRRGDFLCSREDGTLFGVPKDYFSEVLSEASDNIPAVNL